MEISLSITVITEAVVEILLARIQVLTRVLILVLIQNPNPSNPSVLGATRPSSVEPGVLGVDREPKVPEVLGALRQVATGDASFMALYGLFAALSLMSLLFWGLGYKKQGQKKENRG